MGWTATHKPAGEGLRDFFIRTGVLRWSPDAPADYRVLDSGTVNRTTFYAAVERVDKATGAREVWAAVILVRYGRGDYNIAYKDMDETMGPCEAECPARILDLLTPTESKYAQEWRERCRAHIAHRKAMRDVKAGDAIQYGGRRYTLTSPLGRRGWMIQGDDGARYRLSLPKLAQSTRVQ